MGKDIRNGTITISVREVSVEATLRLPADALGVIVFAHGSGSNRFSPRNERVAEDLYSTGFGTLLLDLLTPTEAERDNRTFQHRFDVALLASRLSGAVDWLAGQPDTANLPLGLYGASTGAGAAIVTAAQRPNLVRAVVSRGGRPDLAGGSLPKANAPTLLIVGELDAHVLGLNRDALTKLGSTIKDLKTVPGATHLFEEPGAMDQVSVLAQEWFSRYLPR